MKNFITIAIIILSATMGFATSTPNMEIAVEVESLEIFASADFDAETENLSFTTNDDISMVQIFNEEGEMEFQLPVMSNNVQINKNLFGEGTFTLGFLMEGQSQLHSTTVTIR